MKRKSDKPKAVSQVLQGLFENGKSPLANGFQRYKLEQNWPEIVGPELSRQTRPVDYNKGLLTIAVTNPALLTELQFFRSTFISKVNKAVRPGWVRKLRFVSE